MRRTFSFVLLLFLISLFCFAEFKLDVKEHVLPNGMKILMVVKPGVPRVTCHVYYRVGSINERPGITGIAHVLEHMMFKGTRIMGITDFEKDVGINKRIDELMDKIYKEKFWKREGESGKIAEWQKEVDELLKEEKKLIIKDHLWETYMKNGGTSLNASTSFEVTGYYVNLPANKIELQMLLESDRMKNAYFREFYSEKDVVMEERRLSENRPGYLFEEQLRATFFIASPYHWNVIGWMDDLKRITKKDLMEFYKKYYVPNNAVAVYVGDFNPSNLISLVEKYFGNIPRGEDNEPIRTYVPPQNCEKRVNGEGPAPSRVTIMFHIPPEGHPDTYPLTIFANILSGDTGILYKNLVKDKGVATRVFAFSNPMWYAGSFTIQGFPNLEKKISPEELEKDIWEEIEKIKKEGVKKEDIQKAKNKLEAQFLRSLQNPTFIAMRIGRAELNRGWRSVLTDMEEIRKVTEDDVKRAVTKYFVRGNSVIGIYKRAMRFF
ncbi:MAG: M16 family metallopeptidase [Candidatus Aminicenantia bacterium]